MLPKCCLNIMSCLHKLVIFAMKNDCMDEQSCVGVNSSVFRHHFGLKKGGKPDPISPAC